jgi:spore germination cell wall hydrolase CwlJ-like protein
MSRKTLDALVRADRSVAIAVFLVVATVGTAAAYNPYADSLLARAVPEVSQDLEPAAAVTEPMKAMTAQPSLVETQMAGLESEENCLADVMYFEARGDGARGEEAVAEVVLNRTHDGKYPTSICGVVRQGLASGSCQFSYVCDPHAHREAAAWAAARRLASEIMNGYRQLDDITGGATSYHATYVEPGWTDMVETARIGSHVFFRRGHAKAMTDSA